ncbi:tRNA (adenosine(37)-N6)-dimethylallyltransferase MiaA [Desulfallas sp. Bu1-1]|uniref:tRNA (adenosine(37)-N6)-dimethylallyltransferase MiaA n=1 Tax=Desulfallas sp. Bu1-1 TaxID=2787620 RepID=UPI001FABC44D|nr:tRNA (adenosine(37)-N6)-dimethylallyltransferase MiaA [Desulfallas sp. Bu1-1]
MDKIPLLIIAGPTATGKSAVAVQVAKQLDGEVVSADSMLIYRRMDIGTAKPTLSEMEGIPHHLIDIVEPDANFTVAVYQKMARKTIAEIDRRGRLPILVGGTGFYIDAVIYDYDFGFSGINRELRDALKREAEEKGNEALYQKLREVDPRAAERIHVNDVKRIIRALEIYHQAGGSGSLSRRENKKEYPCYAKLFIGLSYNRDELYRRIEARVDKMINDGLVSEVAGLLNDGYHPGLTSMKGLGYKEIAGYLQNEYSLEEAVKLLKRNTRRFAKRQLTWFKRYSSIKWIDMEKYDTINNAADKILSFIRQEIALAGRKKKEKIPTEGTTCQNLK